MALKRKKKSRNNSYQAVEPPSPELGIDLFTELEDEIIPITGQKYLNGRGYFSCPYATDLDEDYDPDNLDADLWQEEYEEYTDEEFRDFVSECYADLKLEEIEKEHQLELPRRWYPLNHHDIQQKLVKSLSRFIAVAAGRRSGKTDIAKRKLVLRAIRFTAFEDGWFVAAAPTLNQAKRIFWKDLKALVPKELIVDISESELSITLWNGAVISVVGLDKPDRIEGTALDGFIGDEWASVKESVWTKHVRPALSTIGRPGWAILFGVPEGRNHFYTLCQKAKTLEEWDYFHWKSEEILSAEEIESAKEGLDELSYDQEYNASFVNFEGRAYYKYSDTKHDFKNLPYNDRDDLIFCFDFNVSPGTATVIQEIRNENKFYGENVSDVFSACIGEVHIPKNSNTPAVVRKLIDLYPKHQGRILLYGDATGGNKGTAKTEGSDWDLIERDLNAYYGPARIVNKVPKSNPRERARVNAVNTRLETSAGKISFLIDPTTCPKTCEDLEGVTLLKGGSGEIDKKADDQLTHLTDGLGYYIVKEYPVAGAKAFAQTALPF